MTKRIYQIGNTPTEIHTKHGCLRLWNCLEFDPEKEPKKMWNYRFNELLCARLM